MQCGHTGTSGSTCGPWTSGACSSASASPSTRIPKCIPSSAGSIRVDTGPVHEEVHTGADLDREGGGLDELPVPISTPGFDNAPYTTCSQWITKDPDTGGRNVGHYRGQVK